MLELLLVLFTLSITLIINFYLTKKKILLDKKYSAHKSYTSEKQIPLSGGLVILISLFFFGSYDLFILKLVLVFIFLIGFFSDINYLNSPVKRLILQIFFVTVFILINQTYISSVRIPLFDNFLNNFFFKYLFTLFCLMILINGSNFIDGLNSLSIGYFLLVILTVCFVNFKYELNINTFNLNIMGLILTILIVFNLSGKLYLGDSGAYLMSFFIGLELINISNFTERVSPYFVALLLWYPAYENLFSIIRKKLENSSAIIADNDHLHQLLFSYFRKKNLRLIFSNTFSALIINFYNLIIFYFATENISQTKNLILLLVINLIIYNSIYLLLKKKLTN